MPADLGQQLPRFAEALDREAPRISVDEILSRGTVAVDVDRLEGSLSDRARRVNGVSWGDAMARRDELGDRDSSIDFAPTSAEPATRRSVALKTVLAAAAAAVLVVALGSMVRIGDESDPADVPLSTVPAPPTTPVEQPTTVPAPPTTTLEQPTSGEMWPQSTLEEARAAQEFADAGDPAYTWQLDSTLAANGVPWGAEIFARFIEEALGWENFSGTAGYAYAEGGGRYDDVLFIRCAPGRTNPLSTLYADAPAEIRGCAPTINELKYETVSVTVTQPGRGGPSGIWVVDRWEMLQSTYDPGSLFGLLYPDYFAGIQVEQVVPPSDVDVTALLQAFLRARVDGAGAEQYLFREPEESGLEETEVPLLYATTTGAPYEESEIERVQGPVWPNGWTEYKVRLFAEGDTVVEQYFHVVDRDGQLGLVYGYASNEVPTTENGQAVAVPQTIFGEGTMTLIAPPVVPRGDGRIEIPLTASGGRMIIGEGLVPMSPVDFALEEVFELRQDCSSVANGTALPMADGTAPDFATTETVAVSIAGIDGLQMDVTVSEQDLCYSMWSPSRGATGTASEQVPAGDPGWRMRLYVVDYPESAWPSDSGWRPQVLTITVIAPQTVFDLVLEEATPILESLEFRPG